MQSVIYDLKIYKIMPFNGSYLTDRLGRQLLSRLKADRLASGNRHFLARSWIAANASLSRLDHKDAKASKLDPLAQGQSILHRIEK